jgi:excisionase family DNA binding protein
MMGIDSLPTITTVKELAGALRLSEQTIIRAIKRGELKALKVGKVWRIEIGEVKKWLNK